MSNVADVTDATFADLVLKSSKPVVVDYWADWCAPCKQLSPIIDELARDYGDKVTFVGAGHSTPAPRCPPSRACSACPRSRSSSAARS